LDPWPLQPAGAAARRRRRLYAFLPPFRHVEHVFLV
jgi:hypothetical protein